MLTFLLLRTLYVATLQRSLGSLLRDMILRCMLMGCGGVRWGGHTRLQQKTISTLKRLVCKGEKKCPIENAKNLLTKREFGQLFARKFGKILLIEVCVSL